MPARLVLLVTAVAAVSSAATATLTQVAAPAPAGASVTVPDGVVRNLRAIVRGEDTQTDRIERRVRRMAGVLDALEEAIVNQGAGVSYIRDTQATFLTRLNDIEAKTTRIQDDLIYNMGAESRWQARYPWELLTCVFQATVHDDKDCAVN